MLQKVPDRSQCEKKSLHEAKSLFRGIFSDLRAPDFFAASFALAGVVLSVRVRYNEEHFADSASSKTISCLHLRLLLRCVFAFLLRPS